MPLFFGPPRLRLIADDSPGRQAALDAMAAAMTRPRMAALIKLFRPLAGRRSIVFGRAFGGAKVARAFRCLICQGTIPSPEVTRQIFVALYGSVANVRAAFEAMPRAYAAVMARVLDNVYVSGSYIKACVTGDLEKYAVPEWPDGTGESYVSAEAICNVLQRAPAAGREEYFTLDTRMLRLLSADMERGAYLPQPVIALADLPGGLRRYSLGTRVTGLMQAMRTLIDGGDIEFGPDGAVSAASLRAAAAIFAVSEPYAASPIKPMRTAAVHALLMLTRAMSAAGGIPADIHSLKARLAGAVDHCTIARAACPWLENLRPGLAGEAPGDSLLRRVCAGVAAAAEGRADRWLDAGRLAASVFRADDGAGRMGLDLCALDSCADERRGRTVDDTPLTRANVLADFTMPLLLGTLMEMAWLGLLEVAVDPAEAERPYSGLRYVRLTAAGRYVVGIDNMYVPGDEAETAPAAPAAPAVTLDPDRLLAAVSNPDVGAMASAFFGNPVAPGLYVAEAAQFMRGVGTPADLDAKCRRLLAMCGAEALPPLWEAFVDGLRRRLTSVREATPADWMMYDIDPACGGLIAILRDELGVRALIRLVEGNSMLVRRADIPRLDALLRGYGYVLPAPEQDTDT